MLVGRANVDSEPMAPDTPRRSASDMRCEKFRGQEQLFANFETQFHKLPEFRKPARWYSREEKAKGTVKLMFDLVCAQHNSDRHRDR